MPTLMAPHISMVRIPHYLVTIEQNISDSMPDSGTCTQKAELTIQTSVHYLLPYCITFHAVVL